MAFERAKIVIKEASVGTGIKAGLSKFKGAAAKMRLSVSKAEAATHGWADGDKLEILIGTGEHHGLIRIRKNNSAGEAVVKFRKVMGGKIYVQINLGHQAAFVDRAETARWCQFEKVEDGWLEIVLPKWADETAPRKPASSILAQMDKGSRLPPARGANVTASVMGDPPPNRRAMLEKVGNL